MSQLPATLLPSLRSLNEMLTQFWPGTAAQEGIPIDFWRIEDEILLFDALQYLPSCIYTSGGQSGEGHSEEEVAHLPKGFRTILSIFKLESELSNEGWDGVSNLGDAGIRQVIAAYEEAGLTLRAKALTRVLKAYEKDPEDSEQFKRAAGGALQELVDDRKSVAAVAAYIRSDPEGLFGVISGDA